MNPYHQDHVRLEEILSELNRIEDVIVLPVETAYDLILKAQWDALSDEKRIIMNRFKERVI